MVFVKAWVSLQEPLGSERVLVGWGCKGRGAGSSSGPQVRTRGCEDALGAGDTGRHSVLSPGTEPAGQNPRPQPRGCVQGRTHVSPFPDTLSSCPRPTPRPIHVVTHTLTTSQTTHHCHPTRDYSNTSAHSKHTASRQPHSPHPTSAGHTLHTAADPDTRVSCPYLLGATGQSSAPSTPHLCHWCSGGPAGGCWWGQEWPLDGGRQHLCHPATTRPAASAPHSGQNPHLPSATRPSTHTHLPLGDLGRTCGYRDTAIREPACCDTGGQGWAQMGPRPTSGPCVMKAKSPSLSEPPRPHL